VIRVKDFVKVLANIITTFVTAYAVAYGAGLNGRGAATSALAAVLANLSGLYQYKPGT